MARTVRRLLTPAFLGGILALPAAYAQNPTAPPTITTSSMSTAQPAAAPQPIAATQPAVTPSATAVAPFTVLADGLPAALPATEPSPPAEGWEPEFLRTLPRPLDLPRSLFLPPSAPGLPPPELESPYIRRDPLLDPPQWSQPGWFWGVEIGVIHPHLVDGSNNQDHPIVTKSGRSVNVALRSARLDWTIAPRIEIGYRLPSGLGQLSVADRFFSSSGTGAYHTAGGTAIRSTKLSVNYTDFDYGSQEYTPWENWGMKWRAGVRQAETYIRTQSNQSLAQATAGQGILYANSNTSTVGAGIHFTVELERKFPSAGFSFINKFDVGDTFSRLHQNFSALTTTTNSAGQPEGGVVKESVFMQLPMLNWQVGLGWQPPGHPNLSFFVGYTLEAWWNVERRTGTTSNGNFTTQGVVLQGGWNF